jgi:mono/diheme cytochrome c family protein
VLLALTAGQKTGLGLMAAAFIGFALASSFWIPRYRPDFPGRAMKLFVTLCILLMVGMLAAVIAFAKEKKEPGEHSAAPTTTAAQPPPAPASKGDPAQGKALFEEKGCGSCHTFGPAGAVGTVGPDLANLPADAEKAGKPLDVYIRESITNPNAYVVPGYPKGVMPPFALSQQQLDDLAAFLTQQA